MKILRLLILFIFLTGLLNLLYACGRNNAPPDEPTTVFPTVLSTVTPPNADKDIKALNSIITYVYVILLSVLMSLVLYLIHHFKKSRCTNEQKYNYSPGTEWL